ncbi:acylphosphatase [Nakamurella panacisegetis]|uniref:acylphosphatase n=1 Tax=Nakamurella panacisegetis TaxID=1090615 RepID=A0A1H0T2A9_9ACTN|nr:acylphosphatase [Nakamurella panacisegetis]SDP48109.1 acylphosphatase [Nakamurella panacisegetis]
MTDQPQGAPVRLTAFVHGQVQGVGFRWWTRARALELGLRGSATNLPGGRVQVVAEGPRAACEALLALLRGPGTPGSVTLVVEQFGAARGEAGFVER